MLAFPIAACSTFNTIQKSSLIGYKSGEFIGENIGKRAGNTAIGVTIGTALGSSTGAFIGKSLNSLIDTSSTAKIKREQIPEGQLGH